jgi:hypothetical protein
MRAQAEQETLDRIAADADEAARNALANYGEDDWLGVEFAEALLLAARALRQAGRRPSAAVVEAMERCTAAHRTWADVWAHEETAEMAQALVPDAADAISLEVPPLDTINDEDVRPIRVKIGLGDIVQTVLKARHS